VAGHGIGRNACNPMFPGVEVELFGSGAEDGTVVTIPAEWHRSGVIRWPRIVDVMGFFDGPEITPAQSEVVLYRWDGTVTPQGRCRYRETR